MPFHLCNPKNDDLPLPAKTAGHGRSPCNGQNPEAANLSKVPTETIHGSGAFGTDNKIR